MNKYDELVKLYDEMDALTINFLKQHEAILMEENLQLLNTAERSINYLKETGELIFSFNNNISKQYKKEYSVKKLSTNSTKTLDPYCIKLERISEEISNNSNLPIPIVRNETIIDEGKVLSPNLPVRPIEKEGDTQDVEIQKTSIKVDIPEYDQISEETRNNAISSNKSDNSLNLNTSSDEAESKIKIKSDVNIEEREQHEDNKIFIQNNEQQILQNSNKIKKISKRNTAPQNLLIWDVLQIKKTSKSMFKSTKISNSFISKKSLNNKENSEEEHMINLATVYETVDTNEFTFPEVLNKRVITCNAPSVDKEPRISKIIDETVKINTFAINNNEFNDALSTNKTEIPCSKQVAKVKKVEEKKCRIVFSPKFTRNKAKEEEQKKSQVIQGAISKIKKAFTLNPQKDTHVAVPIKEKKCATVSKKPTVFNSNKQKNKKKQVGPYKTYLQTNKNVDCPEETKMKKVLIVKEKKLLIQQKESLHQKTLENVANLQKNNIPQHLKHELPLLEVPDYSDFEEYATDESIILPKWQQEGALRRVLHCIHYIELKQKIYFFGAGPKTVDLQKIFPFIKQDVLQRSSSENWNESDLRGDKDKE